MELKSMLEALFHQRSEMQLANDPLSFCHRYPEPADREVVALVASAYAYGNAKAIRRFLERVFAGMGPSPRRFVETMPPRETLRLFEGCDYRFHVAADLCALLLAIRNMLQEAGSIEGYFLGFHDSGNEDVGPGLSGFCQAALAMDYGAVFGAGGMPAKSFFPYFFPSPAKGSACKRLCMFLRWVVRPADGFDLGLWKGVRPDQLVIPVDAHVQRICRLVGLTARKQADWRMAREITAALRRFDESDPVKYDFSIAHLGISAGCSGVESQVCADCGLATLCRREPGR